MIGDNPFTIECSIAYDDLGVDANDNCTLASVETAGTVDIDSPGDYTVTYTATDHVGLTASVSRVFQVRDTTPPELVLNGDNPMELDLHLDEYLEPGAVATDLCPCAEPVLVITGTVDNHVPGTYEITYVATDASNNSTTDVREVEVINTAPEVSNPIEDFTLNIGFYRIA